MAAQFQGTINGGSGNDKLSFSTYTSSGVTFTLSANNGGSVAPTVSTSFSFGSVENLTGGSGADTFLMGNGKTLVRHDRRRRRRQHAELRDLHDQCPRQPLQTAALGIKGGATGGVLNVENVIGGSDTDILIGDDNNNDLDGGTGGSDILVGLGGNDTLTVHGSGSNILIGGDGSDTLDASDNNGNNLLIGARTDYDHNIAALCSLMAEWSRTDIGIVARISHLTGTAGGRNGSVKLTSLTVHYDSTSGVHDTLTGSTGTIGSDWFITFPGDVVHQP